MTARRRQSRSPNPLVAAAASALIPGLGQWLAGERKKARTLFIIDVAVLAVLVFFFHDRVSILTAFVRPTSMALLMVVNILLLGYRVWAADDAYRAASTSTPPTSRVAALTALIALGVILLMPHVVFGYYDLVQYSLITTVFDGGEASATPTQPQPCRRTAMVRTAAKGRIRPPRQPRRPLSSRHRGTIWTA